MMVFNGILQKKTLLNVNFKINDTKFKFFKIDDGNFEF